MSGALRSLLAEFQISVDKAGELARGNEAVSALKARLGELQAEFAKVKAPAAAAGKAVQQALGGGKGPLGSLGAQGTAQTLRGTLAGAVNTVRAGFNGGGSGGDGPGLIASLATVRNGLIGLGVGAAVRGVKRVVDGIGDIREASQRLGVTTDTFQRLRVLAEQNGTSVESLGTAFRTLASSAVQPTKESAAAFAQLGVSAKDVNGQFKSTNDLFFEVAGALADVGNETERSALAQDLLGRSAQGLKPIFAGGRAEIERQRKALGAMNVLSEETIAQADNLSDSWKAIGPSLLAAGEPLLKLLLPALTDLTTWLVKGITFTAKWLKNTDLAAIGLTALGVALATKVLPGLQLMVGLGGGVTKSLLGMAGAGAKAALSFLRVALPLLAIEDFIAFLRGGDSETGRLLDAVFGKGSAEGTLAALKDLGAALKDVWNWLLGNGMGDSARTLYRDLSDFVSLMTNNLLKLAGIGKGGLNGPLEVGGEGHKLGDAARVAFNMATGDAGGAVRAGLSLFGGGGGDATIPAPGGGQHGPPSATGMNGPVTYGDNIITIHGMRVEDAKVVGDKMEAALERDRNAIEAQAP